MLFDLLPAFYVSQLVSGCKSIPAAKCRMVVLQLDLVGFTHLSATVGHMALAQKVHELCSDFDLWVKGTDLFKIDTIEDCYIVVGWLPQGTHQKSFGKRCKEEEDTCAALLKAAESLLKSLLAHGLTARIGIHMGEGVAGVQEVHAHTYTCTHTYMYIRTIHLHAFIICILYSYIYVLHSCIFAHIHILTIYIEGLRLRFCVGI